MLYRLFPKHLAVKVAQACGGVVLGTHSTIGLLRKPAVHVCVENFKMAYL